jgi:hypothetical protein
MGQILDALNAILAPDQIVELRCISPGGPPKFHVYAGHYRAAMEADALRGNGQGYNCYVTLKPLKPEMLTAGHAAKDGDVLWRRILPVDIDPDRPDPKLPSTEKEKDQARVQMEAVLAYLGTQDWPNPIIADSGSGWHLLYRIDLPADDGGLVHDCLKALKAKFPLVYIKNGNASRIFKVYGTIARKGENTEERPHRMAKLVTVPQAWPSVVAGEDKVKALVALAEFWICGFRLLGREVPYHTSEDVDASLHELGTAYHKQQVAYQLAFPDTQVNRMRILRFLLAEHVAQMPHRPLLDLFDRYAHSG